MGQVKYTEAACGPQAISFQFLIKSDKPGMTPVIDYTALGLSELCGSGVLLEETRYLKCI